MTPRPQRESFFATCAPGLEPLLHAEARALGLARLERQIGGVHFEGGLADAWRANLWLRTAVRVLLRVARFQARDADELYRGAAAVDWSRFLGPEGSLVVSAHARDSALDHTLFVEQRVKDAVVDRLRTREGLRPSVDPEDPDLRIHAHVVGERATLLADTSGASLHKRGWRRYQGSAPLAETLAAAVILHSGWDRRSPLLDPFAGSGTLLIEAALQASGTAPGLFREGFGFRRWPGHDEAGWQALCAEARSASAFPARLVLRGSDVDPEALAGAAENLEAAGLAGRIELAQADARELRPRAGWNAWIAANPPYGRRVGDRGADQDLESLYRDLAEVLRTRCKGFRAALLVGEPALARLLAPPRRDALQLMNGAIRCELVQLEL